MELTCKGMLIEVTINSTYEFYFYENLIRKKVEIDLYKTKLEFTEMKKC
jgi:hypothetical protein